MMVDDCAVGSTDDKDVCAVFSLSMEDVNKVLASGNGALAFSKSKTRDDFICKERISLSTACSDTVLACRGIRDVDNEFTRNRTLQVVLDESGDSLYDFGTWEGSSDGNGGW